MRGRQAHGPVSGFPKVRTELRLASLFQMDRVHQSSEQPHSKWSGHDSATVRTLFAALSFSNFVLSAAGMRPAVRMAVALEPRERCVN